MLECRTRYTSTLTMYAYNHRNFFEASVDVWRQCKIDWASYTCMDGSFCAIDNLENDDCSCKVIPPSPSPPPPSPPSPAEAEHPIACPPQWMPLILGAYHFAHGTFQPAAIGSAHGCADLDSLLGTGQRLAAAIDVCFDDQFSCDYAEPFVGTGTIFGKSSGNPQTGTQASIQLQGSESWLPARVPVHAPRGSRTSTHAVPVVGCLVHNDTNAPFFVLSWADIRCRSTTDALFPARCDGASQRNVAIEDTNFAISFVDSLIQESRRKLGFQTPVDLGQRLDRTTWANDLRLNAWHETQASADDLQPSKRATGTKSLILILINPSDDPNYWNSGMIAREFGGSPEKFAKAVVRKEIM